MNKLIKTGGTLAGSINKVAADKYGGDMMQAIFACSTVAVVDRSVSMLEKVDVPSTMLVPEGSNFRDRATRLELAHAQLELLQRDNPGELLIMAFNESITPLYGGDLMGLGCSGGTSYSVIANDAILTALNKANKRIIIISDGEPASDGVYEADSVALLQLIALFKSRWPNPFHSIYIGDKGSEGEKILHKLTHGLGGITTVSSAGLLGVGVSKILALGDGK